MENELITVTESTEDFNGGQLDTISNEEANNVAATIIAIGVAGFFVGMGALKLVKMIRTKVRNKKVIEPEIIEDDEYYEEEEDAE